MTVHVHVRRIVSTAVGFAMALFGGFVITGFGAPHAEAAASPVVPRPADAVTADPLPTVQIDGIVWTQAVNGNTVYAGGSFNYARPAGAAPGTNQTPRANLLSYNITTGNLDTGWNPSPNGQVQAIALSPDKSRVYVGGSFTTISGQTRYRIAAYDTATGALISSFKPVISGTVKAIAATNETVYVGGVFGVVNGNNRSKLAAFRASDGALLTWAPTLDSDVTSMVLTPDGTKVVFGGSFQNVSGQPNIGIAAVDAATGAVDPWPVNQVVQNGAAQSGTYSLSTDNDTVYGTSYNFGDGNFEGEFAMNQNGDIKWLADCHGDTYAAFSVNNIVYGAGHQHFCSNIGGYPEFTPRIEKHIVAFTKDATGTVLPNGQSGAGYGNFAGQPSPSIIDYFPDFTTANVSGAHQAVWSLTGNTKYLAAGGEFPTAGGVAQQGLVRFAISSIAPNKAKVKDLGGTTNPTVTGIGGFGIRVGWKLNWDPDDMALTYKVVRQDKGVNAPIDTETLNSTWWQRPTVSFVDKTAQPGQTYNYRVYVTDAAGNGTQSDWVKATMPSGSISDYGKAVLDDGATNYWPLDDAGQSSLADLAGGNNLSASSVSASSATALGTGGSANFNGSAVAGEQSSSIGPQTFTAESWIRTTSTTGGKIIGFGDQSTSTSSSYDRHIYMDNSGHLTFGVYPGAARTVTTSDTYNDGDWHYVVATLSSSGMSLWVDGIQRASSGSATSAQSYTGYWRLGGDNLNGWPNTGSSNSFNGQIDDTAIYPTALTGTQIRSHYTKAGGSLDVPAEPTDAYGKTVYDDNPTLYWRLDDESGPTVADAGVNLQPGVASGGVSYGSPSAVTSAGTGLKFDGSSGTVASRNQFSDPTVYSLELWFNTTTTHGGKLIGFGNQQSGNSTNYDRHVYMENSGQLTFGTWTGAMNTATSDKSYNDGAWHHLVASQGFDGMKLYVDGQLVATNSQTGAQGYDGYWRIGGDTVWSGDSNYFDGTIDEVAVYPVVLTGDQVLDHYEASPAAVNQSPVAAFTPTCGNDGSCSFDAAASEDPDGTVASYEWDFGDGSAATGEQPEHSYTASGNYTVKLTVTDDHGKTDTVSHDVTISIVKPPTASFTSFCTELVCSFDGSASSDPDGSISSYAWDFGDGNNGQDAKPDHQYSSAGTYTVALTVTDDQGNTDVVRHDVTVATNAHPVAAFTATTDNLSVSVDGSDSSDPDGTIASYAWDYGDGQTGAGKTDSHTYSAAGDYQVKLTVTDNDGAENSVTKTVTATAADGGSDVIAKDDFGRSGSRWGTADDGGAWSYDSGASAFSTDGDSGNVKLSAGTSAIASLDGVGATDFTFAVDITLDKVVDQGAVNVGVMGRKINDSYYSIKVRYLPGGVVHLVAARRVNNGEVILREINVPGVTYAAGDTIHLEAAMTGTSPTHLTATIWKDGTPKPANPQLSETDSTAVLQSPGAVGVSCYLATATSNGPVVVSLDNLLVTSPEAP